MEPDKRSGWRDHKSVIEVLEITENTFFNQSPTFHLQRPGKSYRQKWGYPLEDDSGWNSENQTD